MDELLKDMSRSVTFTTGPSPEWARKMQEDYQRTGGVSAQDISRVLGDQSRSVQIGPKDNSASFYLAE